MTALGFLLLALSFAWRSRPAMAKYESYNAFFPKEKFLEKIACLPPEWMTAQLEADFKDTRPITADGVQKVYETIAKRVLPGSCQHYRILNNQLYQYSEGGHVASRDSLTEKALKTLLSQIRVPDVDFILIPMDGIPEKHMPADFYLMDDPRDQVPVLGNAKLKEPKTRSVVLIPNLVVLSESWFNMADEILKLNGKTPWIEKKRVAFWRGGTSDVNVLEKNTGDFSPTPRWNLCTLSLRVPEKVDARFYTADSPTLRQAVSRAGLLSPFVSKAEHLQCKYLPDLDGHMCSSPGLLWKLLSDSLTLKQESDQVQWFHKAILPYVHYLPIANDMSDIVEKIVWAEMHEKEVLQMIENAQDFVSKHLMYEDCYRYLYLVFKKYAAYQAIDFRELKRRIKKDPHWINIQYRKRARFYKMIHRNLSRTRLAS
jgi:Glycosyl transferase family 90